MTLPITTYKVRSVVDGIPSDGYTECDTQELAIAKAKERMAHSSGTGPYFYKVEEVVTREIYRTEIGGTAVQQ